MKFWYFQSFWWIGSVEYAFLNPIWSEIQWPTDNSTGTPNLLSGSVRTEPDDSGTLSLSVVSFPHLSWWPGKRCSHIDLESVTPPLKTPWGQCPVISCPPECSFLDWKSVEKEEPADKVLTPILFGNLPSPHSRPKDHEWWTSSYLDKNTLDLRLHLGPDNLASWGLQTREEWS